MQIWLPVENTGLVAATGTIPVSFRQHGESGPEVAGNTVSVISSGTARYLGPYTLDREDWGTGRLVAVIDPDSVIDECDEEDNLVDLGNWPCP